MNKQKRREALHEAMNPGAGHGLTEEEIEFLNHHSPNWQQTVRDKKAVTFVVIADLPHHGHDYDYVRKMTAQIGRKIDVHTIELSKADAKH